MINNKYYIEYYTNLIITGSFKLKLLHFKGLTLYMLNILYKYIFLEKKSFTEIYYHFKIIFNFKKIIFRHGKKNSNEFRSTFLHIALPFVKNPVKNLEVIFERMKLVLMSNRRL